MGTTTREIRLAITAGDPFGIGPEVIRKALASLPAGVHATVFGDPALFDEETEVVSVPSAGDPPEPRGATAAGGRAALAALDAAIAAVKAGRHDALVTGPISKEACVLADGPADGHTPMLERAFETDALMTFVWDEEEPAVALLTHHVPLRAVAATMTGDRVERAVRTLHTALAGKPNPRIAVLGLNPHAGEAGRLGTEDADFIAPAIRRLQAEGIDVSGPWPGDATWAQRRRYDAILAMYHDQGLAPVKALAFDRAVQISLGLPVVRTSPAHGTAFDIAGRDMASAASMQAAIEWAVRWAATD
ncbi:MAG: 4-hydroxythreonine-4-phosphate dehydrogenase PdxA [Planctomycetota bacterium]